MTIPASRQRRRRRSRGRRPHSRFRTGAERTAGALVLLLLVVFGWQAFQAFRALSETENLAPGLQAAIAQGDVEMARTRLAAFEDATDRARRATDGPLWWLSSRIPVLGRNPAAIAAVSREADRVATDALPTFIDVADQVRLDTFRPHDGKVDLNAVRRTLPVMTATRDVMEQARRGVDGIEPDRLFPTLTAPVAEFQTKIRDAAVGTSAAVDVATLMPDLLGGDGRERTYLLLVLNNAEVRSIGGMPGSAAVITAKDGEISMGRQGGATDIRPLTESASDISAEQEGGFSSTVGSDLRDTAVVPDFPRAAELAAAVVEERWDENFDGVIAVDPVALGYALGGLGPVDVGDGIAVNEQNAVLVLLSGVYHKYATNNARQDDVFELAARRSFDALTDGGGDSVKTIRGLVRGVQERRILLWLRDDDQEDQISNTRIAGAPNPERKQPEMGFFVNDGASGKMEFYLRMGSHVRAIECHKDRSQTLGFTSVLTSAAPVTAGDFPVSVNGTGVHVERGSMRLHTLVVAPPGARILDLRVDGKRVAFGADTYRGRPVARVAQVVPPGRYFTITAKVRTAPGADGTPTLRTTPGIVANNDTSSSSACD